MRERYGGRLNGDDDSAAPGGAEPVDPADYPVDVEAYRRGDHAWLDELDRVTVHVGEPHQRMATRVADDSAWLPPDGHRRRELLLRRRLLDEAEPEVFGALPGSEAPSEETAAMIGGWLADNHPDAWALPDRGHPHPLARAGLAVQEDLCLLQRDVDGGWRFTAAVICFPTYWRLHEKLGRRQEAVHGPVPHYATDLAVKVNRFFDRLVPGRIVARRNWGFAAHPLLFVPDLDALDQRVASTEDLWIRSERQTLRRLPASDAVLFTIKVQLAPVTALAERPAVAGRLLAAIEGWSPELLASRGSRYGWLDQLPAWLRTVSESSPHT